jgi:hypothetical protein
MEVPTRTLKRLAGRLDYHLRPRVGDRRGPFNSQQFRLRIFEWVVDAQHPTYMVETGTHRGGTTAYMAERGGVPVFGIEIDERRMTFARLRLRGQPTVTLLLGDSQVLLRRLLEGGELPGGLGFYYLDAHWGEELPLANEIDMVFDRRPESLVMIDDFQVPDDPGYGYDDYGPGKTLTVDYVRPAARRLGLRAFFPACPSAQETGSRRGTLMLARASAEQLAGCVLLREWTF